MAWREGRVMRMRSGIIAARLARTFIGVALGVALGAEAASALAIGGTTPITVDPVYYKSGGAFGFVSPKPYDVVADPTGWKEAGAAGAGTNLFLTYTFKLQEPVYQNPQFPANSNNPTGPAGTPSPTNPFVADSIWTVTNISDETLVNPILVFTKIQLGATALVPGGYPDIPVGIDDNLMIVVKHNSSQGEMFFGGIALGTLEPGASQDVRVRYIVAGNLPINGDLLVMPPFGLAALTAYTVPEPGTLLLVGGGAALLAVARRRRCD